MRTGPVAIIGQWEIVTTLYCAWRRPYAAVEIPCVLIKLLNICIPLDQRYSRTQYRTLNLARAKEPSARETVPPWQCYREKFRNFVAWAEPDPKTTYFRVLGYTSTILRTAYREQFYSKPMVPMESRDSEGVPFVSLESLRPGICRYRPLKGAEKWSRDHHENWKFAYTRKNIHRFQKCYSFRSTTKK